MEVGNLISGSSAFSKSSLNIWKFLVHILLKPGLEIFEHYFASMWDVCNCVVVWTFFGIVFLWNWNENRPLPVLWPLLSFPNLLAYWVLYFHSIIPKIWKPTRFLCPWDSQGKNTGVGCHAILQGIFPTQGSNPGLLHCRWILYHLSHPENPSLICLLIISSISASSYCGILPPQPVDCTALLLVLPCSPGVSPTTVWLVPFSFNGCPCLAVRCTLFSQSPLSTIQMLVFHIWRPLLFSRESQFTSQPPSICVTSQLLPVFPALAPPYCLSHTPCRCLCVWHVFTPCLINASCLHLSKSPSGHRPLFLGDCSDCSSGKYSLPLPSPVHCCSVHPAACKEAAERHGQESGHCLPHQVVFSTSAALLYVKETI